MKAKSAHREFVSGTVRIVKSRRQRAVTPIGATTPTQTAIPQPFLVRTLQLRAAKIRSPRAAQAARVN